MTAPNPGVAVDHDGGITRITITRPERMNALEVDTLQALSAAVREADADPRTRVVVLTGAGRAFCTGADLTALDKPAALIMDSANSVIRAITSASVPVIAAVNGPAVGFGVSLASAADLTYAAQSAYFLLSFTNIGLMPDGGASWLVPAAIGRVRAAEMTLLGERMSAAEAERTGLVARVLPDDQLAAAVDAAAGKLAVGPRRALELTKKALGAAERALLDEALERERAGQIELFGTADFVEGTTAVMEKRTPIFP